MDRNSPLDYVEKTATASIEDTKEFITYVRKECRSDPPRSLRARSSSPVVSSPTSSTPPSSQRTSRRLSTTTQSSTHTSSSSTSAGLARRYIASSQHSLVQPILTPRFAISCSDTLMAALQALLAKDPTLHIQTHLAENPAEIEFTKQLFPFTDSYTHGQWYWTAGTVRVTRTYITAGGEGETVAR